MELKISDFEKSVEKFPTLKRGCIVDTNVLFSGSYPLDIHNDWADEVFRTLNCLGSRGITGNIYMARGRHSNGASFGKYDFEGKKCNFEDS